jgi:AhpD family alkylhydroperoxidase
MLIHTIENQIFRKLAPRAVRYLQKPDLKTKNALARKVLQQAAAEFQVAPPVTIHLADPALMAAYWCLSREAFVVNARGRAGREAVAAAVSRLNACPYCVTVHSGMFESAGEDPRQLDEPSRLPPEIYAAHIFAAATLSPGSKALEHPRVLPADRPQIFATAFLFHYTNRMVSVFLGEAPVALPGMTSAPGRKLAQASLSFFGKRIVQIDPQPGRCASQTAMDLPAAFSWAKPNPFIAGALAQFAANAERAGDETVPAEVRRLVIDHLAGWTGETAPLSRGWVEQLAAPLKEHYRPAAQLALVAARAPYQVDDSLIRDFRQIQTGDRALMQTVAWASFAAARRIANWFPAYADDCGQREGCESRTV